ncbi:hypothetical protein [Microtetraspora malaysiensis]|uniref:hypothetical protein n=1 Tax=Microtetraspora malaysiensis TaxID=161358 RepID=UPI003D8A9B36
MGIHALLVTTSATDHITAEGVEFARSLAQEAASFAQSVERMFHGLPDGREVAACNVWWRLSI